MRVLDTHSRLARSPRARPRPRALRRDELAPELAADVATGHLARPCADLLTNRGAHGSPHSRPKGATSGGAHVGADSGSCSRTDRGAEHRAGGLTDRVTVRNVVDRGDRHAALCAHQRRGDRDQVHEDCAPSRGFKTCTLSAESLDFSESVRSCYGKSWTF